MPYLYILKIFRPESKLRAEALQERGDAITAAGLPKAYPQSQHCRNYQEFEKHISIHGPVHLNVKECQHKL